MGRNGQQIKEANVVPVAEACSSHCPSPSFVVLPDLLTFVFSWQGDQLCIRTKYRGTEHLLYVDDVVIATKKSDTMSNFKSYLHDQFKMTDLREIIHFIGIQIDITNGEVCLNQSAYIKNVLRKFIMEDCNSVRISQSRPAGRDSLRK